MNPPRPAAFPRQHKVAAARSSATEFAVAAEVMRQRRMDVLRFVAARAGVETVPTADRGIPDTTTLVPKFGDQVAIRLTPK